MRLVGVDGEPEVREMLPREMRDLKYVGATYLKHSRLVITLSSLVDIKVRQKQLGDVASARCYGLRKQRPVRLQSIVLLPVEMTFLYIGRDVHIGAGREEH